ncbi:hypothetical protein ACQEVS_10065 [Streptomyces sp. CA-181903]|uniref:hypothetical protein n=1 Tax=Streptomyces sp. CA-181903 TaxID=3240055 RepID=UPI003D902C20
MPYRSPEISRHRPLDRLLATIHESAQRFEGVYPGTKNWAYQTAFHLVLDLGRGFTATAPPAGLGRMPARECYANAARYALEHHSREGVIYVEGFASSDVFGGHLPLAHAWCVRPDGTVIDPTWVDGLAYVGIPFAETRLWPVDGFGLLDYHKRLLPLLHHGIPEQVLADVGHPLPLLGPNDPAGPRQPGTVEQRTEAVR